MDKLTIRNTFPGEKLEMNLCLTGLSPWKWHFKLWNTKHNECFVLCSKRCHMNWTFLIISAFLTPSYSSVKWHSLWNILWLRESSFPSSGGGQKCHTQCLLCNPHKGVYIIYSMGRPWLSVVVLEDLLLFVYLKNVSVLLWTRKHQNGGKKYNSPSHRLSSTKEPITERKRWHVGV